MKKIKKEREKVTSTITNFEFLNVDLEAELKTIGDVSWLKLTVEQCIDAGTKTEITINAPTKEELLQLSDNIRKLVTEA